jgi:hypothetical protein
MVRADSIRRRKGKLAVTTFGKIVFNAQKVVKDAYNLQWELKVLIPSTHMIRLLRKNVGSL